VWAKALSTTAYVPRSGREIERLLRSLLDELFDSLSGPGFNPGAAREVGVRLVAENFIGEQSLSRTVEVLGQALPVQPELRDVPRLGSKMICLLGALAAGFAAALRARTLDQQEQVKQALLRARQNAERGLRVSEARFRELFASAAVGLAISDLNGTLVEANQALGEILGASAADLIGRSVLELLHPADAGALQSACQELRTGQRARVRLAQQVRLRTADSEPAWAYLAVSLLHDAEGEPTHQVTVVREIPDHPTPCPLAAEVGVVIALLGCSGAGRPV
jgi:PAS domain S-box-containing protein